MNNIVIRPGLGSIMVMLEKHVASYSSKTQIKTKDEANFTIVMMVSKP